MFCQLPRPYSKSSVYIHSIVLSREQIQPQIHKMWKLDDAAAASIFLFRSFRALACISTVQPRPHFKSRLGFIFTE